MLRIFIGYDPAETVAYHVLSHSLLRHASQPISITPLVRPALSSIYTRERLPSETTDFSLTRFLVPYLCQYRGHALFLDCDMLCQSDIVELFQYVETNPYAAVQVVKHDYTPSTTFKFLHRPQSVYPRKNWSSVMLFDNSRCQNLTPHYVNTAEPLALHRFQWVTDQDVYALPREWNWLVGEYPANNAAKLLHYTIGTPCFNEYSHCDHAYAWFNELSLMQRPMLL